MCVAANTCDYLLTYKMLFKQCQLAMNDCLFLSNTGKFCDYWQKNNINVDFDFTLNILLDVKFLFNQNETKQACMQLN